jgi:hypothetical protein
MSDIQSFIGGASVTLFVAGIKPERWIRWTLMILGVVLGMVAFFWPNLSPHFPELTKSLQDVASNAWAWFALVVIAAFLPSLAQGLEIYKSKKTLSEKDALALPQDAKSLIVHYAGYGLGIGEYRDVTEQVKSLTKNGQLKLRVGHDDLQCDPYRGKIKQLMIVYSYGNSERESIQGKDEQEIKLSQ